MPSILSITRCIRLAAFVVLLLPPPLLLLLDLLYRARINGCVAACGGNGGSYVITIASFNRATLTNHCTSVDGRVSYIVEPSNLRSVTLLLNVSGGASSSSLSETRPAGCVGTLVVLFTIEVDSFTFSVLLLASSVFSYLLCSLAMFF